MVSNIRNPTPRARNQLVIASYHPVSEDNPPSLHQGTSLLLAGPRRSNLAFGVRQAKYSRTGRRCSGSAVSEDRALFGVGSIECRPIKGTALRFPPPDTRCLRLAAGKTDPKPGQTCAPPVRYRRVSRAKIDGFIGALQAQAIV